MCLCVCLCIYSLFSGALNFNTLAVYSGPPVVKEEKFTIRFVRRSCSTIFFTLQLSASTRRQPGSAASRRSVASKRKGNAGISMWRHLFSWGRSSHISLVSGTPSALAVTVSTCTCWKQTNLRKRSPGRRKTHKSQTTKRLFSKPLKF